jgi:hypothetical protein
MPSFKIFTKAIIFMTKNDKPIEEHLTDEQKSEVEKIAEKLRQGTTQEQENSNQNLPDQEKKEQNTR